MSYGRSSLIVTLVWVGMLLRVYHETMLERRGSATVMAERRMTGRPILIMAGGTGGHVFPALALARRLREQAVEVIWLGTRRGLEARVIPAEGIADRMAVGRRPAREGMAHVARGAVAARRWR